MCLGGFLYPAVDVAALVAQGAFLSGRQTESVHQAPERRTGAANRDRDISGSMVALETRGRRSGRVSLVQLVMAQVGTERYLVSMLGDNADWVRNAHASAGAAVLRHGTTEKVRLEDVPVLRRARSLRPIFRWRPALVRTSMSAVTRRSRSSRRWLRAIPYSASSRSESSEQIAVRVSPIASQFDDPESY